MHTFFQEITEIMRTSRNPEELKDMWLQWRNQTGKKMRKSYAGLSSLVNEAAIANG